MKIVFFMEKQIKRNNIYRFMGKGVLKVNRTNYLTFIFSVLSWSISNCVKEAYIKKENGAINPFSFFLNDSLYHLSFTYFIISDMPGSSCAKRLAAAAAIAPTISSKKVCVWSLFW